MTWLDGALCAQIEPDAWFPEQGASAFAAKKLCARCEVTTACLEDALNRGDDRHGVRGGMSPSQRRRITKGRAA